MEFKSNDLHTGQARVYVLPDDVGRRTIDRQVRSLRRPMQQLLSHLDISEASWMGRWEDNIPVVHLDSSRDVDKQADASLFKIFNTLPSPNPQPDLVTDRYARSAMYDILDSNVKGLDTTLYMYQRRSTAMMLQREAQTTQLLDPRLRELADHKGNIFYCDPVAGICLREPRMYETDKGGILAENMGLGKTLISLTLILATKGMTPQIPIEYSVGTTPLRSTTGSLLDMAAATINRTGTPWMYYFNRDDAEEYEFSNCAAAIRRNRGFYYLPTPIRRRQSRVTVPNARKVWLTDATIVVVPANLIQQWVQEIHKHTHGLKVLVVSNSKDQLPAAEELVEYDILLFSRQRFDKEAQDGNDPDGRRTSTPKQCHCPYIGSSRNRDCTCLKEQDVYHSPLKYLHFKRLITDEGHVFGNASKSSITDASTVVQFLQVSSRWIVSGTPTDGLYGTETSMVTSANMTGSSTSSLDEYENNKSIGGRHRSVTRQLSRTITTVDAPDQPEQESDSSKQERKDLEKLGNIATRYLKVRPWANPAEDNDVAQWSHYVMQPRHGSKCHGNIDCLRSTLEGMIIRNRPDDVQNDVSLPPLHQSIVALEGSLQDKMSLNTFSMMIVSNAVTSERKDADYLFHPRQRAALDLLVKNLRQASFHWSGFSTEDIQGTTDIAKDFLKKDNVPISADDKALLQEAIRVGEIVLSNPIKKATSEWHEMPMYVQNEWPHGARAAWSLNEDIQNPTLMGATMIHSCQQFVEAQLWKEDPIDGLEMAGKTALSQVYFQLKPKRSSRNSKATGNTKSSKPVKKADQSRRDLAGGIIVATGDEPSPMKHIRASTARGSKSRPLSKMSSADLIPSFDSIGTSQISNGPTNHGSMVQKDVKLKSAMKASKVGSAAIEFDPASPLASTVLVSTSSAKLTYLIQRIILQHKTEKILVFYESDNVAYYIAQALECLHIRHLIYAKSLPPDRKSQYVVTFNRSETFRVLLMDISQAAFGLDMSSASRVYFVNPVLSPQVEAQAVKRAHRIGQKKPVFVETLVLKGGIEEVILERRKDMSNEEHKKCKDILNDSKIYDWIRNVRFIPLPDDIGPGPDQMAKLDTPELVFGRGSGSYVGAARDPNADLLMMDSVSSILKGKRKATVYYEEEEEDTPSASEAVKSKVQKISDMTRLLRGDIPNLRGLTNSALDRLFHEAIEQQERQGRQVSDHEDEDEDEESEGLDEFERFNRATKDRPTPTYGDYPDLSRIGTPEGPSYRVADDEEN